MKKGDFMAVIQGALAMSSEDVRLLETILFEAKETISHKYDEAECRCPRRSNLAFTAIQDLLGLGGKTIDDTAKALSLGQFPESLKLLDNSDYEVFIDMPPPIWEENVSPK